MGTPTGLGPSFTRRVVPLPAELLFQRDATAQTLDEMHRGFMVTDHSCRVMFSNRTAQEILERSDGLQLSVNGLCAARARDTADLRGLIRHAASPEAPAGEVSVLTIWRPSLKRMLLLRITPIQIPSSPLLAQFLGLAAIFLHDPIPPVSLDETALARLYGFTKAECRLITLVLNGSTMQQAAMNLAVTLSTARTHLKHILMKADTNRQTQLISLLLGSVLDVPELDQ